MASEDESIQAAKAALQAGDFAGGLAEAERMLASDPADGEALYLAAVACRYLERRDEARAFLDRLHAAMPEYGRAWKESPPKPSPHSSAQRATIRR